MRILLSVIRKEALHIVRDSRTMAITLLMPLALLLLFGFAISTEVDNVRVIVAVDSHDDVSRDLAGRLEANRFITFAGIAPASEAESVIRQGDADAAVVVRHDKGRVSRQIVVDASNPVVGRSSAAYLQGIMSSSDMRNPVITTPRYNPQMKSAYN
ncbi:MAG: ABC transporter permease, partial [Muribaculaceae bacterium]|nr:ABC transporter permease [Muribaculaceae bacterium]